MEERYLERTALLETLQDAIIFQRFPCNLRKCLILQENFCRHIQKCEIIFVIQYLDFQKQLVGGALKM